jgi:HSP20 family protein
MGWKGWIGGSDGVPVRPAHPALSVRREIMTIVRWDPFQNIGFAAANAWVPPVDIYQNGDQELVLKAELPDIAREDIDITVESGVLTVKGEKKLSSDVTEEQFHHVERRYGAFSRSFSLPQSVDPGKVSAEYKHGVLTVRLPMREEAKPRSIKVDVAA